MHLFYGRMICRLIDVFCIYERTLIPILDTEKAIAKTVLVLMASTSLHLEIKFWYVKNILFKTDCNYEKFDIEPCKMLFVPLVRGQTFHSVPQSWCSMTKKLTFPCR